MGYFHKYSLLIFIGLSLNSCNQTPAIAQELTIDKVIPAILGEAPPGASNAVLACFAHAIRNRGSLQGVFGRKEAASASEWQRGGKTWAESETSPDPTKGAQFWLSKWDIKHCRPGMIAWRHKMIKTVYIGETNFYREYRK